MKKSAKMRVDSIVDWNVRALGIQEPEIIYADQEEFLTPTTLAATARDGKSLKLSRNVAVEEDARKLWFALSHELRHVYQIQKGTIGLKGYVPASETSVVDYNSQEAEIDANAWMLIAMATNLGIRPTLENQLGDELWHKIVKRAEEIAAEYK